MNKRTSLLLVILLVATVFAGGSKTAADTDDDRKLYENPETPTNPMYVRSDLKYTHVTSASTTATVLKTTSSDIIGGIICPGTATFTGLSTGLWAAPDFEAKVSYYGVEPPPYAYSPVNQWITWHSANYDLFNGMSGYCKSWDACYGKEGTLVDSRIAEYAVTASKKFYNRLGSVAYLCAAKNYLTVSNPLGVSTTYSIDATGGITISSSKLVTLNLKGVYTFEDGLDIRGCAAIVRYPTTVADERVFTRTIPSHGSAPEYSRKVSNLFTITVQNRQNSLQYLSHEPAGAIKITPGKSVLLKMKVKNNGDVGTTVYDANDWESATCSGICSNTFIKAAKYDSSVCSAIGGIGCPSDSGFGTNIATGAERDLYIILTAAPDASPGAYTWTNGIILYHQTNEAVCNSQNLARPFNFSVQMEEDTNGSCTITPASTAMQVNTKSQFNLTCYNSLKKAVSCGSASWTLQNLNGNIVSADATKAVISVSGFPGGAGRLNASITNTISCVSEITIATEQEPGPRGVCVVEPGTKEMTAGKPTTFTLACYDGNGKKGDCPSATWSLKNMNGKAEGNNKMASVAVAYGGGNSGELNATVNSTVSCLSKLTLTSGKANTCEVEPDSKAMAANQPSTFTLSCYDNDGKKGNCQSAAWSLRNINGQIVQHSNTGATVSVTGAVGGKGELNATVNETLSCLSNLTIENGVANQSNATSCNIVPSSTSVGRLEVNTFSLYCYDSNGLSIPCDYGTWSLVHLQGDFINWTNARADVYVESPIGSTGQLSFATAATGCVSNLTVVTPRYTLAIYPETWTINKGETINFTTSCSHLGSSIACGQMNWVIMPGGLLGSLSDTSSTGAKFTGSDKSTGRIRAHDIAYNMVGFTYGSVLAGGNQTANDTNATKPGDKPPNKGDTDDCRIRPNPFTIRPGMKKSFSVWCGGPTFERPCPSTTTFSFSDYTVAYVVDYIKDATDHVYGAYLLAYQPPTAGKSYTLSAMLDATSGKGCSTDVSLGPAVCWEVA